MSKSLGGEPARRLRPTRALWYIDLPMSQLRLQTRPTVHTRICLACGYSGVELQRRAEAAVFECPCCGEDLYARRPMSYAEMEGLEAISRIGVVGRSCGVAVQVQPRRVGLCPRLWRWLLSRLGLLGR